MYVYLHGSLCIDPTLTSMCVCVWLSSSALSVCLQLHLSLCPRRVLPLSLFPSLSPSALRIPPAPAPVTHAASLRGAGVPLRGAVALCPLVATTSAATPLDHALAVDFARMLKDVTPTGDLPPTHHTRGQNLKATKKKKSNTRLRARSGRVQ